MKKFLFFLGSCLLFLISCSNSEEVDGKTEFVLPKIIIYKTVNGLDSEINSFSYDGNKIISITNKFNKTIFTYDGDEIVKEVKYHLKGDQEIKYSETSYSYLNNKLVKVLELINGRYAKYVYTYNEDTSVTKELYNIDEQTGIESKGATAELLLFENGNLIKQVLNLDNELLSYTSTAIYEYDTNNNVFKNILGFNSLLDQAYIDSQINISSLNNIKKQITSTISQSDIVFEPYFNIVKYDYNDSDYPIKKTSYNESGVINEIIEYRY